MWYLNMVMGRKWCWVSLMQILQRCDVLQYLYNVSNTCTMSFIPVQRTGRRHCVVWSRTGPPGHWPWPWTSVLTAMCLGGGGPPVIGCARAYESSWWSRRMPAQTLRDAAIPATVGGNTHQSLPAMSTQTVTSLLFVGLSHNSLLHFPPINSTNRWHYYF